MNTPSTKVALITGASRGIGKAIALALAKAGYKLALLARDSAKLESARCEIEAIGGIAHCYQGDVVDAAQANAVVRECEANLGPIDLLVNNAGSSVAVGPLWECDLESLWKGIETNIRGPIVYSNAVLPSMLSRRSGVIINMGSYASIRPIAENPGYAASKAALVRLTDSLAASTKQAGIDVFTVSPGLVLTDMTRDVDAFKDLPAAAWSPIGDVCKLVCELSSGNYSTLSGRFIHVHDDLQRLAENLARIESENLYTLQLANLDGIVR